MPFYHLVNNELILDFVKDILIIGFYVLHSIDLPFFEMFFIYHTVHFEYIAKSASTNEDRLFCAVHVLEELLPCWIIWLTEIVLGHFLVKFGQRKNI